MLVVFTQTVKIFVYPKFDKIFVPGLVYDPTDSLVTAPYASPIEKAGAAVSVPPS